MATASPSPLAASTETTNGVKLRRLLVDGGTTVLRKVFDRIHPPKHLAANLHLNNSTLDDLFARGILSEQQRNCLYPSDGSKPDSKTFDITLLFLLLTEICGLSLPPRKGWNHKPQAKNKSLAANLVRIKLFRNKLLHTPETRIDSLLFDKLWKEISGVLVSLGLDQAEINRLKTERCGEEDYLDVLFKWADREKEIKSKLEEVCQSQIKMQKAVETVGQTQQEQQKILQDTKTAVEMVGQSQQGPQKILQDTKTAVERVGQTQQEQQKIVQDTKTAVETVGQTQQEQQKIHQDTKTAVETVRQTQQEQQKIVQDTKTALETVDQTQQEQQKILQDTKTAVETVGQTQQKQQKILQDTKAAVETVGQTQRDQQKILQDTKTAAETAAETVCQTQHEHLTLLQDANAKLEQAHETQQVTKSNLETIHQSQAKTQETVERLHHTQLEDHETLNDNRSKLNEVHQTQTKTRETVEGVRQTQLEDRETLQYSTTKLDEVHQTQSKTHETIERVHQTQLEDRETLQYSKTKLDEVHQSQEEHFETLRREVKQAVKSSKEGRDSGGEDRILQNLARSEFKGDVEYLVGRYQEGTREWVFNKVENWLDDRNSRNRLMVISANAGMGKSIISAVICKRMHEAGRLSGSHFCQHNNARYQNPQLMLQSLAYHLCNALPEYKQALVKQLSRNLGKGLNYMGVEELFALLFKEPLGTVADPGRNMLMVIDGLDESDYQERNELLDVLANHLSKLPCWIRFLCTTRPERNISEALKHLKPFQLESNDDKNMEDIKRFIGNRTQHLIKPEKKATIVEKLVEKSEGLMLYAYFLVLFIEENKSVLDQGNLDDSLPLAISSVYHSYFKRLENELKEKLGVNEENFLNLLSAVIASREPLPIDFVSKLFGHNGSSPLGRRKVLKAISSVSSLLPIRDGCLHVIHKSVKDWLTDTSCYGEHDFTMNEKDGHRILAILCANELDHLKKKGVRDAQLSSTEKYAFHHGVRHMLQLDENVGSRSLEECVQTYVTDLEVLYAKICVNSSTAAEEILWLQSQECFRALFSDSKDLRNILMLLLRKYFDTFKDHAHLVSQTLVNEGGPFVFPLASNMVESKYYLICYLEFVNKQMQ